MMETGEGVPIFDPGSPVGTPLSEDTPASVRRRNHVPDMCSPIAPNCSPCPQLSPMGHLPSPASKRYAGVSSNARNNIYLKTLMNSPYHNNYAPLPPTPGFSPAYQTQIPARTQSEKHEGPYTGVTSTPQGTKPHSGAKRFVTPKNVSINPFENDVEDLHLPAYMSPGFFTMASTPASEEKQNFFNWSIEHIAELNPAAIDEMPAHQTHSFIPDRETEERAQRAIEQFFATNLIAPSPWSDPKKSKKKNILPATPASQGMNNKHTDDTELQGSIQKTLAHTPGAVDASCQTMLSLPLNFDLQKVLGAYMSHDGNGDDGNQQDMLSTSSLRRKLFFHGDTSSLAPSPVKGVNQDDLSEACSPAFTKQVQPNWERSTPLRNTPTFSSSPIRSAGTPQYSRCSSDPEFLESPELSPIVHGNLSNTGRKSKSRSSGIFQAHGADFEISPVGDFGASSAGRDSLMSPIPFHGISPDGHDEDFRPKFEDSPGFSPIRPPKTPIRKILRKSQEESYIQDEGCDSDDDGESVTPVSTNPKLTSNSLTPVESISPRRHSPRHRLSGTISKSHSFSCTDLQHTMDFESVPHPRDSILTSSLCHTRDFSASADFSDDTHQRTSLSNQDTGYQTASLQSTNQESVSLHTNLTNQFGSMPFNVTNQDTSHMLTNQDKPPVLNLTQHFSLIANQDGDDDDNLNSIKNNQISASVFPKQKLLFMDDDVDFAHAPKNSLATRQNFEDSALPEDFSSSQGRMEIDMKCGDTDSVDDEEEVLGRARQALALANSLYPCGGESDMMGDRSAGKHTFSQKCVQSYVTTETRKQEASASEIAYSIIQRAGEDLAKYGNFLSTNKTTELTMEGLHGHT